MKALFKKMVVLLMVMSMVIAGAAVYAENVSAAENQSAVITSGTCGKSASWTYNVDTKQLTVKGTGEVTSLQIAYLKTDAEKLVIEEGITGIGDGVFNGYNIITVQLPESLKTIGASAFYRCVKIKEVSIPKNVEYLGDNAFGECPALEKFTILGNVKTEGALFGEDCPDVLELGGELDKIAQILLNGEETTLPKEIKFINNNSFYKLSGNYVLSSDGTKLLYYIGTTSKIEIPKSVTEIDDYALYCKGVKQIVFNKKLETIGDYAFYRNNIKTVSFPSKLKTIGKNAFSCNSLKTVKFNKNIQKIGENAFADDNNIKTITLYNNPKIEARAFGQKVKIKYGKNAKMRGSFALADFVTDGKTKSVKLILNNVTAADGYKVKITQPGTGKTVVVNTKKRTVEVKKGLKFKTTNKDQYTLKENYALNAKVRPYKLVNGKKVYGKWSVKSVIR